MEVAGGLENWGVKEGGMEAAGGLENWGVGGKEGGERITLYYCMTNFP